MLTATRFLNILSYLPVALYAESLRVQRGIVSSICNPFAIPTPLTGCVKDLERLWELEETDILDGLDQRPAPIVCSLRNGNYFPLVNRPILDLLGLTSRRLARVHNTEARRLVVVNVTYIIPRAKSPKYVHNARFAKLVRYLALIFESSLLIALMIVLVRQGFYIATGLVICLLMTLIILVCLQWLISVYIFRQRSIRQDSVLTTRNGAALDVHVIAQHWNTVKLDVLVGYSSQLHALTNVAARIAHNHRALTWAARALAINLTLQAALLVSVMGTTSDQAWTSTMWLGLYIVFQIPSWILDRMVPASSIVLGYGREYVPEVVHLPPAQFSGRRAALVFVATLPHTPVANRWDWIDGFIPRNERRRKWERDVQKLGLFGQNEGNDSNAGTSHSPPVGRWEVILGMEVREAQSNPQFVKATAEFKAAVMLT